LAERGIKALAGPVFFGVCALLVFAGAFAIWPAEFFGTQFSDMAAGTLIRAIASPILAIVGLEFLAAFAIAALSDS